MMNIASSTHKEDVLKDLLDTFEEMSSGSSASLSACIALSRISISMSRLVSTCDLEDSIGTVKHYSEKGRKLLKILERKLSAAKTVTTRARIISAMYHLNHDAAYTYDDSWEAVCSAAVKSLYDDALSVYASLSELESAFLCQCIAHTLYLTADCDGSSEQMRKYFNDSISSWMSVDWVCDFSPSVVIARLHALVCNSDMFMDTRYDRQISIMSDYLCRKMDTLTDSEKMDLYHLVSDKGSPAYSRYYADCLSSMNYSSVSDNESLYLRIDHICRNIEYDMMENYNKSFYEM